MLTEAVNLVCADDLTQKMFSYQPASIHIFWSFDPMNSAVHYTMFGWLSQCVSLYSKMDIWKGKLLRKFQFHYCLERCDEIWCDTLQHDIVKGSQVPWATLTQTLLFKCFHGHIGLLRSLCINIIMWSSIHNKRQDSEQTDLLFICFVTGLVNLFFLFC